MLCKCYYWCITYLSLQTCFIAVWLITERPSDISHFPLFDGVRFPTVVTVQCRSRNCGNCGARICFCSELEKKWLVVKNDCWLCAISQQRSSVPDSNARTDQCRTNQQWKDLNLEQLHAKSHWPAVAVMWPEIQLCDSAKLLLGGYFIHYVRRK